MDIKAETKSREQHTKIISLDFIQGKRNLCEMAEEGEIPLKDFVKWEQGLAAYKRRKKEDKPDCPDQLPNPWNLDLPLNNGRKCRHYWIWSEKPNTGKTTKFL